MRVGVAAFLFLQIYGVAGAQEPKAPTDSVPPDTSARDSVRAGQHGGMMFALAAVFAVAAVAPSALTTSAMPDTTPSRLPRAADHVTAYVAVGASWIEHHTWSYAASIEMLRSGWYGEMRVEAFYLPEHFKYQSLSVGYLFRTKRVVAGGATVGYRRASRDRAQRGVMIGFPLIVDAADGSTRLESTYVFSPSGVNWNYRLLIELAIADSPFSAGFTAEAKTLPLERQSKLFASTIALLIGIGR